MYLESDRLRGRPNPKIAPALVAAGGGKTAEPGLDQRSDPLGIEVPHQQEGEVSDVDETVAVDRGRPLEIDLGEQLLADRSAPRMPLRERLHQAILEHRFGP